MLTLYLIIATSVLSFISFQNHNILGRLIFNPFIVSKKGEWYRFISSGFIHADWIHLLVNMFVLFSFGGAVEHYFQEYFPNQGKVLFLILYFGGLMCSILPTYKKHRENPHYNALGASGAVSSVVFAFILFNPLQELCLYGILCLPGIIFGAIYLFYCYYMGKKGGDNINHDAHMWGAIYGFVFTILLKPELFIQFFNQIFHTYNDI
ncbi:MAG: rhomboid family intramembrane serine protease [Bacteroidetes bacterium]|nr:MAG: rhomboid family intramembrane serine protease [Bacteroidota bacterium]REJ99879.1 MAG: rhomboid family intramembrane serine protease [Bacteroidota bacterium]REK34252.1 MAG: rhomboid family intramembrane serine protease [Bacteroidota bacterium]REK50582.1 MAG: rhomboid family intramembrane serine protease [Bacteroidota bacterium]